MPLFTFEGADGCGKTTTLRILKQMLICNNIHAIYTKEPAGTEYGERVRQAILDPDNHLTKLQQVVMFLSARKDHLSKVIIPALAQHKVVICDRYVLSNMAYQGSYTKNPEYDDSLSYDENLANGRQEYIDKNHILAMNEALPEYIWPDLTVYLQAKPEYDVQRLNGRTDKQDKIDANLTKLNNMKHLQWQYRCALKEEGTPYLFVNADRNPVERASYIYYHIANILRSDDYDKSW